MAKNNFKKATFAGGCFWCMEPPYSKIDGVKNVVVGYAGGKIENPSYEEVSTELTGHREAVQITYDHEKVDYKKLLEIFWTQIDPTDEGGQFADRGSQYKTAIFYHDDEQKRLAEESKRDLEKSRKYNRPIATEIIPFSNFYAAEEYHQKYYKKNPERYAAYKRGSGRESYIKKMWGKSDE